MKTELTQREMVLMHLKTVGSITTWQAFREYGATRLSAIIFDLKKAGHEITGDFETSTNRFGQPVTFKRYKLEEQTEKQSKFGLKLNLKMKGLKICQKKKI